MELEKEKESLKEATAISRLMADVLQQHDKENKRLWAALIAMIILVAVMAGCMIWGVSNAQRITDEALWKALKTVGEISATNETTTVNQDAGEGNGNAVYQAGENATYTEGGAN